MSSDNTSCLSKNTLGRAVAGLSLSSRELQACWVDPENMSPSSDPVLSQASERAKVALTFCSLVFTHPAKQMEPDTQDCKASQPHKTQTFPFSDAGIVLPGYWWMANEQEFVNLLANLIKRDCRRFWLHSIP